MVEKKNSTGLGEFTGWSAGSNDKLTHPSPCFLKVLILGGARGEKDERLGDERAYRDRPFGPEKGVGPQVMA
jgi:hypothetical protein